MPAAPATYLDSNAGAPLHPSAALAISRVLAVGLVPNPSSIHAHGRIAKRYVAEARERIALSLGSGTDPEQIVFTSSGSEANQLAIRGVLEPRLARGERPHWITTPVEHDSVRSMAKWLEERGGSVSYLPVDAAGAPVATAIAQLVRPETALVSGVWVNNETGVISDVRAFARACSDARVPLHLDAAQAWGKLPVDVDVSGASLVTFSGHKVGAPAGVGVVWLARGTRPEAVIAGKQEKGRRGGTENVLGIVGLGAAAGEISSQAYDAKVRPLRDRLEREISLRIPGTRVNGATGPRVGNTLNLSFDEVESDGLVMALDLGGYSVSSGSACASGAIEPSHILLAMGRSKAQASAAVRVSLPGEVEWTVLEGFIRTLEVAVARVRGAAEVEAHF
jgi:cysteine desulfurase